MNLELKYLLFNIALEKAKHNFFFDKYKIIIKNIDWLTSIVILISKTIAINDENNHIGLNILMIKLLITGFAKSFAKKNCKIIV